MKVDTQILAALCRKYGPQLNVPEGMEGAQLLWALSGNESSFGQHCPPRHEDGYCYGHRYYDAVYSQRWGCLAHSSFSPWQIMATNAKQYTPLELLEDPEKALNAVVTFLNTVIFGKQGAKTLSDVGDAYNTGNFRDANIPEKYIADLHRNYQTAMPAEVAA